MCCFEWRVDMISINWLTSLDMSNKEKNNPAELCEGFEQLFLLKIASKYCQISSIPHNFFLNIEITQLHYYTSAHIQFMWIFHK